MATKEQILVAVVFYYIIGCLHQWFQKGFLLSGDMKILNV